MRVEAGGIHLNYELTGDGTPLVLTHGLGNDLRFWDDVEKPLAEHHRLLRWDVRGFGASDKPPGPYGTQLLAADLAALLDALGLERVHLAGLSMGGVVAQRFALDFGHRVRSLILISTSSEVGERAVRSWQRLADRVEREGFDERTADASPSFSAAFAARHPARVRALSEQVRDNDPAAYAAAARAVSEYNWTADLSRVAAPTLILQGLADRLTPPGGSVRMQRALPRARLLLVADTGHFLPLERPILFACSVLAFTGAVDLMAEGGHTPLPP
jgi:3-oxoadipate enol-lactonase